MTRNAPNRNLLDEDTAPNATTARRNRSRVLLWLLVLFLVTALGVVLTIIGTQPGLLGLTRVVDLNQTSAAVDAAYNATISGLEQTAQRQMERDADLQSTGAALNNLALRLGQTETRQALNDSSTRTAVALASVRQGTQVALDFAATQSALQLISTQIQRDFEATQTAVIGGFATLDASAAPAHVLLLDGDFLRGVENASQPALLSSPAWALSDSGTLVARANNATLLTRQTDFPNGYALNAVVTSGGVPGVVDVLFGVIETGDGYTIRLTHDGSRLTQAVVMRFPAAALREPALVIDETAALYVTSGLSIPVTVDDGGSFLLDLRLANGQVSASVNGVAVVNVPLDARIGSAGLRLDAGAQVTRWQLVQ